MLVPERYVSHDRLPRAMEQTLIYNGFNPLHIKKRLGYGNMNVCYLYENPHTAEKAALKMPHFFGLLQDMELFNRSYARDLQLGRDILKRVQYYNPDFHFADYSVYSDPGCLTLVRQEFIDGHEATTEEISDRWPEWISALNEHINCAGQEFGVNANLDAMHHAIALDPQKPTPIDGWVMTPEGTLVLVDTQLNIETLHNSPANYPVLGVKKAVHMIQNGIWQTVYDLPL